LKLHALAFRRSGTLPFPEQLLLSSASANDLTIFKTAWANISNITFWGDEMYYNRDFFKEIEINNNAVILTPVKEVKGQSLQEKQRNKATDNLISMTVLSVRQPIEAFFNWLIEKTDFQRASKVRSTKGLLLHVFGKMAASFNYLICNS
jgi:hypothetical protein